MDRLCSMPIYSSLLCVIFPISAINTLCVHVYFGINVYTQSTIISLVFPVLVHVHSRDLQIQGIHVFRLNPDLFLSLKSQTVSSLEWRLESHLLFGCRRLVLWRRGICKTTYRSFYRIYTPSKFIWKYIDRRNNVWVINGKYTQALQHI